MRTTWQTVAFPALAALAALTFGPGTAVAQLGTSSATGDAADAVEYEREAQAAVGMRSEWGKAASLFEKAGEARADDPAAAGNFRMAGLLSYYVGRDRDALQNLTRAAETALAWGDVEMAARSYLDAAWVAHKEGNGARTLDLAQRAERLAQSPLLQRQERAALLSRIADGPQAPAMPRF